MKTRRLFIFMGGAISLFMAFNIAFGASIYVPANYSTIQAGIDAAQNGNTVLIANGTYTGDGNKNLDFKGKEIIVQSENGPDKCIIDCENKGRGFIFQSNEGKLSVLSGITITNGKIDEKSGGGIYCSGASPTISNCIIIKNRAVIWTSGGGISCNNSSPIIENCTITGNSSEENGGGIHCVTSSPTIINCTVSYNSASEGGGGVYYYNSSSSKINNCIVNGNSADERGGGICCMGSSPKIMNCIISDNSAAGQYRRTYRASQEKGGGGIWCKSELGGLYASPTITNCVISGNMTRNLGGGLRFCYKSSPVITNCTITENTDDEQSGGFYSENSTPIFKNCIIWGISNSFKYIFHYSTPELIPEITYCNVKGIGSIGVNIGNNNIDADPLFLGGGNYHLKKDSPCIDTGTSDGAPDTDMDGNPRPQFKGYDIGVYEYTGIAGDIDNNEKIDIGDAIIALKIMCGIIPSQDIYVTADINGDKKIGTEEAIYVLQIVSIKVPVADAGADQNVTVGSLVELDGSGSNDADDNPLTYQLTYQWSFTSKPEGSNAVLSDNTSVNPTFTTDIPGIYVLSLVVNDGSENSAEDSVTIVAETSIFSDITESRLVWIPGGSFQMGGEDSNAESDEYPLHTVTISGFYMGAYEVTQTLWIKVMGTNPSKKAGDKLPVENVSWYDVQTFLTKLNEMTGETYRLPTEAEWEFAARGGVSNKYGTSNGMISSSLANYYTDNIKEVGNYPPNPFGLYDMSGNVWEWVNDWYSKTYYKTYDEGSWPDNPQGPSSGTSGIIRGGSVGSNANTCRCANRFAEGLSNKYSDTGFRIVK